MTTEAGPFPSIDLVPKKETRALDFLKKHPDYDGRNVRIGILDTGIFPGAHAVMNQADGAPKLVDVIDCSGSGDVELFDAKAEWKDDCWQVQGLSGRTLKLGDWKMEPFPNSKPKEEEEKDAAGEEKEKTAETTKTAPVRRGIKRAYELFPSKLTSRVKKERKRQFDTKVQAYAAEVRGKLAECTGNAPETVKQRDDLEARLDILTDTTWNDEDPGPIFDCIVFYDGTDYWAAIDVEESGQLQSFKPMTNFRKLRQFGTLGVIDQMNYAINIFDEGTILSIVTDTSPHGTHVAGISAAAEGERSGVAPGAELVSLKIGDTRLNGMETGTSVARAMIEAVRTGCDVINMSYGEGTTVPNSGHFIELAEDLVWKHNVIFVSSAGNNGPAISTVGAPGGTSTAIIGVAAYVSPDMMKAEYSLPLRDGDGETGGALERDEEQYPGTTYTWSSVGPATDADLGVNICAPGGAITSVSHWCLQKSMLMNGTSMSSPNATGCIALLISACKAEGIPVSAARIKRAIENTARFIPHLSMLQQGEGMIDVDAAFEYLKKGKDIESEDIHFDVRIDNRSATPRGVYLRQADECSARHSLFVSVDPQFRREDDVSEELQKRRIEFEMGFNITCDASWVTVPEKFMLMSNGRSFKVDVDPVNLPPGLHTAMVRGIDASDPERKTIFKLPITVAKPMATRQVFKLGDKLKFHPAEVKRFFVTPPLGSTWMDVTIRDLRKGQNDTTPRLLVLHTVQLLPHGAYRDFEKQSYIQLLPNETSVTSIAVEEGVTVELAIARNWSTIGYTKVEVTVEFRGLRPEPRHISLVSGMGGCLVRVHSDLKDETVNPSAKLTRWRTPIRPKADAVVMPLGERDVLPSGNKKLYELVLTYEFTQEEKGSFTPRSPALQGVLYESGFQSQLMLFFDGEKKFLGTSDAYPSTITAPKGTVTMRLQIRHDDAKQLEKLTDLCIWIERSLDKDISLSTHTSKEAQVKGNGSFRKTLLRKGGSCAVFFGNPAQSKLPSSCKPGDVLVGTASYGSADSSIPGDNKRPGGFPITFTVGPKPEKSSSDPETPEAKDDRTVEQKLEEAVRDLKVSQLGKLLAKEKKDGAFEVLYKKLESEYPDHLPLRMAKLKNLDSHEKRDEMLSDVVDTASAIVGLISEDELALHFGRKSDSEDPEAVKLRKEMKDKKSTLTEALARMAMAYADMKADDAKVKFDETLNKLKAWVDIDSSDKYAPLVIERETRAGRYGTVLKVLNKLLANGKDVKDSIKPLSRSDMLEKRAQIFSDLGYSVLVDYDKGTRVVACPKSYTLF